MLANSISRQVLTPKFGYTSLQMGRGHA